MREACATNILWPSAALPAKPTLSMHGVQSHSVMLVKGVAWKGIDCYIFGKGCLSSFHMMCQAKGEKRKFASTEFWADCKDRGPISLDILGVKRCAFSRHMLGELYPWEDFQYTEQISHIRGRLPKCGKSPRLREDFPYIGRSQGSLHR